MTTDLDLDTRTVLSWLREDMHENPERALRRALDEVDTTPQRRSWRPASRRNRMTSYARPIAAAAAVLVLAVGGSQLVPGGSVASPSPAPTSGAADPRSPFVGVWISTSDGDGGTQTMTVERAADDSVSTVVTDTIATVCSGTSSTMTGTGSVQGGALVIPAPAYRCDDGTEPRTVDGPPLDQVLRNLTYRHIASTDTLSVGSGDVWRRQGAAEPTLDPLPPLTPAQSLVPTTTPLAAPLFGRAGNGAIAFEKDGDIYVADRPGGDPRPLVAGPEFDSGPMFLPDGTRLAFRRVIDGEPFLMVADADGTNVVQVMPEPVDLWSFAPDGRSVVGVTWIDGEPRVIVRPLDPAAASTVLDIDLPFGGQELWEWGGPRFRPTNPQEILVKAQPEPDGPRGIYVHDLASGETRTIVVRAGCTDKDPWAPGCYVHDVVWSPTGDQILYRLGAEGRVVAADGSGDRASDDLRDWISPPSNDGTRIVVDREVFSGGEPDTHPGGDSYLQEAVVRIDGEGEPVELGCGLGMAIACAESWIWSPDDSMLLGTDSHEGLSTYLLADPATGQVTELDLVGDGTPTWQRVTSADPSTSGDGSLPVGPHVMGDRLHGEDRVTVTVPAAGWFAANRGSVTKELGDDVAVTVVPGDYYSMPRDICDWQVDDVDLRGNYWPGAADELVAYLTEQTYDTPDGASTRDLPAPEDITIGGSHGQRISYSYPDSDASTCDEQRFCILQDRDGWGCLLSRQEPGALRRSGSWTRPRTGTTSWSSPRPGRRVRRSATRRTPS